MALFTSQFDRARAYTDAYAGPSDDPTWRTPAAAAAAVLAGAGLLALTAAALTPDADPDATHADPGAGDADPGAGDADPGAGAVDPGAGAAGEVDAWGAGWDTGWDAAGAAPIDQPADDGAAWMDRGDYTDAGVGGDGDFFYFIDGDTSLTID